LQFNDEGGYMNLNDLRKIDSHIENLKRKHELRREDYIKEHCPYKLGDAIKVEGYSFRGKKMVLGKIALVKGWSYGDDPAPWKFVYSGYILKKDGTPGKLYTNFETTIIEEEI
jgi:hypothetical protein